MDHWQPELGYGPRGWMQGAANATASADGGQTANIYNGYAAFLLGRMDVAGTSVQNELMTTREWQHNLYARDRWQVNDKLTLDLGLRYEYYPLMQRADRGIEKILGADDLASARDLASTQRVDADSSGALRPTVLLGGKGQSERPRHQGEQDPVCSAPRRRVPDQRGQRVPGRLRDHLQPAAVLAAAARLLPADAGVGVLRADDPYGWATTLEQGIPDIVGSRPELGPPGAESRLLDAHAGRATCPALASIRGTCRTSGACSTTSRWTWRTSGPRRTAGSPTST